MNRHTLLIVAALLLFLIGGFGAIDWIDHVNEAAMICFGLGAYAAAAL